MLAAVLFVALASPAPVTAAGGAGVYWTRVALLKSFFAQSDRVSWQRVVPDANQSKSLARRLGHAAPKHLTFYYGLKGGAVQGFALIDDQRGQHEDITFALLAGVDGKMKRLEVVAYREPRGGEIRGARFRAQFAGKKATDKLRLGHEIAAISGATISSRAMVIGVRRNLTLLAELVIKPGLAGALGAGKAGAK